MRAFLAGLLVCLAVIPAQAATKDVSVNGGGYGDDYNWVPPYFAAAQGDTVTWHIDAGVGSHTVTQYWGSGTHYDSGNLSTTTYSRTAGAGQYWFRCKLHSTVSSAGYCNGMCGGYTNRTADPSAPSIGSPTSGTVAQTFTMNGTAQPWMQIDVVDASKGNTVVGHGMANGSGAWSAPVSLSGYGAHALYTLATDAARHISPESTRVTVNFASTATPPKAWITTRNPGIFVPGPAVIEGTAKDDSSVVFMQILVYDVTGHVSKKVPFTCPCPSVPGAIFGWTATLTGLLPGLYTIVAQAADDEGTLGNSAPITMVTG